jgi:SNF2 family DNA or RNA helicase
MSATTLPMEGPFWDWLRSREARVRHHVEDLRAYQTDELIPFAMDNPYSGLFVDMGLGKTVSVLTILNALFERDLNLRVLIIAPLRVAVQTWPTELAEWSHTWWMTYTLIRPDENHPDCIEAQRLARVAQRQDEFGSPNYAARKAKTAHLELQRRKLADTDRMIHIINREAVDWLVGYHGKAWPYDVVIVDESTSFADHTSLRFKALNKVRSRFKRLHLLTGIPAPEGIEDYFAQIYLLDRGERFGKGITAFRETYLVQNKYSRKWTPQIGAAKVVAEKIKDICIVMRSEDYLDRTKPLVIERPILLEPNELASYKRFERELILDLPDGEEIEADNAAALAQKLLQLASGAVYDQTGAYHEIHHHKLEELAELREETKGTPLLIAYWHKSSLARLRKLLPKATVMDRTGSCVPNWNAGKISELLIHPMSAGHGLNMQLGPGHILVYFDNPRPLEVYLQTIARLDRPGQKRQVKVIHLVTRGTVDEAIVPSLIDKNDTQDAIRKYIRDLRKDMI